MSYFVVWDNAIQEAFDTLEEATTLVAHHPGARVIGDEWVTMGKAKHRVDQARRAIDEVATMIDPAEVQRMRQTLDQLEAMLDEAWSRLGLAGR
jgi:polyhydroxyalkanoate synthesis regulator phasin